MWVVRGRVEAHDEWCGEDRYDGENEQCGGDERDEAIGIRLPIVCVLFHLAHELRDENRIECAAQDQDVDDVG